MKLSQKRICGRCKALNPVNGDCQLYFKTKNIADITHRVRKYAPTEPCYKPMTNRDYLAAIELI